MAFNRLKDIAEISSGFAFKSSDFSDSTGVPVVRISNINNDARVDINIKGQKYYSFDAEEKLRRFLVRKGDVLIALSGATTGKIGIYNSDKEALLNQRVALIRGQTSEDSRYLYYALLARSRQILKDAYGGAQPNISPNKIAEYEFYFPAALNDRSRIVDAIETQFTRLDAAVKSLKTIKAKLETYRQSVLKAAFEGKLVKFNGCLEDKLSSFIKNMEPGFACGKHSKEGKGLIHFRPYNILPNGNITFEVTKLVDPKHSDKRLHFGDVVFNNTNSQAWVGKTCFYDKKEEAGFSNHMTRIVSNEAILLPKYLALQLHSLFLIGFFHKIMKNHVNQSSVSMDGLENILVRAPSLKIQEVVLNEIESRFSVIDKVGEVVDNALLKSDRLRKSILKAAFEGKLVD